MTVPMTITARAAVTIRWLVTVKAYGTMPRKFAVNTKTNSENTNGKNFIPSVPAVDRTVEATNV